MDMLLMVEQEFIMGRLHSQTRRFMRIYYLLGALQRLRKVAASQELVQKFLGNEG